LGAENFSDGLKLAGQHPNLDLALLELRSPGCDGAMSVKLFLQHYPHIPLVVVSGEEDCRVINEAMSYGAGGFVHKNSSVTTLMNTLSQVLSGNIYLQPQLLRQPSVTAWNKSNRNGVRGPNANEYGLTVRQMDILKRLIEGHSNKEIAKTINLSEGTVKAHVSAVYRALRVDNRMDAMRVATQLGLKGVRHSEIKSEYEPGKLPDIP
jgi:DNA-binding NarL/FixJ family response regulator